ncbi:Signal peptidase complex subunit SPC2 [Lachnellula suecica]|uniref:Signal peptidase complex subunit 2 n=1 Tax=Lachnellula suecica TaxID=602035 RepID=A0A8T9C4S9_9HELO|nr:Signal peptidase complex subunit SPC2 [Lachnellula suecica]
MASQERISVHSVADLKNTTDDALPAYLNSLSFTQSHTLTDIRLALGYTAFGICAATFYWDYTYGFESTKMLTLAAVILYSILNGALTFWIWGVEKGTVYVGTHKTSGEKITIQSSTDKFVPVYKLTVTTLGKDGKKETRKVKMEFREWFDAKGSFVTKPFQRMLASSVAAIGRADPKNALPLKEKKKPEKIEDNRSMDEKWASLLAESQGDAVGEAESTSTPTPGKGKRRAKKA